MQLQTLEATPTLGPGNKVNWKLCHTNPSPPKCGTSKADYPVVSLGYNSGAANFQVKIVDDTTGKNIKFADDPIWVKANAKPTVSGLDGQIPPTSVNGNGDGGKVLTFVDKNDNPSQLLLKYQLNFKGDDGPVAPIDPDIRNGGTGIVTPPPSGETGYVDPSAIYFGAAAISALTAAVVAYVVARYMMRGRGPMR